MYCSIHRLYGEYRKRELVIPVVVIDLEAILRGSGMIGSAFDVVINHADNTLDCV